MKVLPRDEQAASVLRHPVTKRRFRDAKTPVDWPADQFTFRRLAEGAIKQVEESPAAADAPRRKS